MNIQTLKSAITAERELVINHSVYKHLNNLSDVQTMMNFHIYAVWDFMSLLKSLQRQFTCVSTPWLPSKEPQLRRFINEIVLEEESDTNRHGEYKSHLEMYLDSMTEMGCDLIPFMEFLNSVEQKGVSAIQDIENSVVKEFLDFTFTIIEEGKAHKIASAFTFGREDLIPDMFHQIINHLHGQFPEKLESLKYYLDRHIELDGDTHGPLSEKMINLLCGDDKQKWEEATEVAKECLILRAKLWSAVEESINLVKT
jgi:hypothetical protein